jgi:hypothetical protein
MKRGLSFMIYCILLAFVILAFLFALGDFSLKWITGKGITGDLNIYVEESSDITIHSPLNTTYDFDLGGPYTLDLNVSALFEASEWNYSLYSFFDEQYTSSNVSFTPNETIEATRGGNLLIISAKRPDESWDSKSVIFTIRVPNSAPTLGYIDEQILVCEGQKLNNPFNASDLDGDDLTSDISPRNPFYTSYLGRKSQTIHLFSIISGTLKKSHIGTEIHTISVRDNFNATCCVDTADVNITVIEINNPPVMQEIGAQTVWTHGENSTFYSQASVSDTEDGISSDGELTFNISFSGSHLFNISNLGIMNYTPALADVGVHNISICVIDNPLNSEHPNISLCSPRKASSESVCDTFSLTVTNENRPPQIMNYTPFEDNFTISGTSIAGFTLEVYDPDGTIPDINWYVDNVLKRHTEGNFSDEFNYLFGCNSRGLHNITAIVTDGLLNVSRTWNVTVLLVVCPPVEEKPSGGGSGGVGGYCIEKWVCDEWQVCQNLKKSFNIGIIPQNDYFYFNEICLQKTFDETICGFQIRECYDLNECNNSVFKEEKPAEIQVCHFVEEPGCSDGIKNCHSGGCELMVDCGGPCPPCPTCSDGIQNQGEEGIDCGGPCPFPCEKEVPLSKNWLFLLLILLLILIILFIIYRIRKILKDMNKGKP